MAKFQRLVNNALIFYSCLLTTGILTLALPIEEPKRIDDNTKFSDLKLRLVSAVFRHGDRTLVGKGESYPNDPHKNISFNMDANSDGQLTNVGKKRAYDLGLLLRDRYNDFLGDVYYPSNVYARSTEITRTKMTLQLVLAGLYPPVDIQKWNTKLLWQPIDMTYTSIDKDELLFPITCSRYHKVCKEVQQESPEMKERIEEFNDLMKNCSKYTGRNITHLMGLFNLYNTLYAQSSMHLDLPKWTQDMYPNGKLLDAALLFLELLSYKQLNNLNGGVLLKWIINDMNKIIAGTQVHKINLFSGHDLNVAAMLHALNIAERRFPGYTSCIIIELYESNKKYFVKVLYYSGNPLETVVEVEIPGCEVLCPYDKFIELTGSTKISESCHSGNLEEPCTLLVPLLNSN